AKFFDIEYQPYGWVFPERKENHAHFHWKHQDDTKCITIEHNKLTNEFISINTFDIRMRHEASDIWLTEKRAIVYLINHLKEANFDPEFYRHFEKNIQATYNNHLQNI